MSRVLFASFASFSVLLMATAMYVGLPLDVNARVEHLRDLRREISDLEKLPASSGNHHAQLDVAREKFVQLQRELGTDKRLSIHLLSVIH